MGVGVGVGVGVRVCGNTVVQVASRGAELGKQSGAQSECMVLAPCVCNAVRALFQRYAIKRCAA